MEDKERLARIEAKLESMEEILTEVRHDIKGHIEAVSKIKTETRIIAGVLSTGIIFIWEFVRDKLNHFLK